MTARASHVLQFKTQSTAQDRAFELLFDGTTRSVGYGGGAGGGKSYIGVTWVWIMCNTYPGVRYFFGRKELKRLKQTTFNTYLKFCDYHHIPESQRGRYNDNSGVLSFLNGSEIVFIDLAYKPSDPLGGSFGGLELTGGFIDESWEVSETYVGILYTRIGRHLNATYGIFPKILETFNPDRGHCYDKFVRPHKLGEETDTVKFIPALAIDRLRHRAYFIDTHTLHPEDVGTEAGMYVASLMERDETTRQRLLWGNFDYDDDPSALITFPAIQDFFNARQVVPDIKDKYITADIATQGSDKFVVMVWYGWNVVEMKTMDKSGGEDIVSLIRSLQITHRIRESHIAYDADGVGGFIGGRGGFMPNARAFNNGAKPMKYNGVVETYQNLKTQCYYHLATAIMQGEVAMSAVLTPEEREHISEELGQVKRAGLNEEGKLRIKSKKLIKADIGRSPDYTDTLAMRFFFRFGGSISINYA